MDCACVARGKCGVRQNDRYCRNGEKISLKDVASIHYRHITFTHSKQKNGKYFF